MTSEAPRQGGRFTWYLRHYAWVVVTGVLALAVAPLLIAPQTPTYQAEALVLARQLAVNPRVLPQLAESLFAGAVAGRVAEDPAVGGDTAGLVPDRLSVVPAQDSIAIVVQARDPDPATAARLANIAAEAYVDELNRGGAGVGTFVLQGEAVVPTEPLPELSPQLKATIGALAGLVLGLGAVLLVAVLRRPVVTGQDVEEVAGVPLLGIVHLPSGSRGYPGPRGVRGIATVTRWLATVPSGRLLLVSPPSAAAIRSRLHVMLSVALWTLRTVRIEAAPPVVAAIRQHCEEVRRSRADQPVPAEPAGELVVVDGAALDKIVDPATTTQTVVAVAPRGVSRRVLRALVAEHADGGLLGVVLVGGRPGFRRDPRPVRARAAAPAQAPVPDAPRSGSVPASEPA